MMIFVESARLQAIAETILTVQPCCWSGKVTADQVKMALAAHDIYPGPILEDVIREAGASDGCLEETNAIALLPAFLRLTS